ncbi:hypothetical protein DMENIID0001_160200 [Sergentomyia squamirostris]
MAILIGNSSSSPVLSDKRERKYSHFRAETTNGNGYRCHGWGFLFHVCLRRSPPPQLCVCAIVSNGDYIG